MTDARRRSRGRFGHIALLLAATVGLAACSTDSSRPALSAPTGAHPGKTTPEAGAEVVQVDVGGIRDGRRVSEEIRGVSGDVDGDYIIDAGITVNSWGGNPATRYNYRLGNAWNAGADWSFRNGNYGTSGHVAAEFVAVTTAAGADVRLAVPTLGWVAQDDSNSTCSFPTGDGSCPDVNGLDCQNATAVADPRAANVPSTVDDVRRWITSLQHEQGLAIRYIAMDNEPEMWGITHYDVHPECTTYEEILDTYLEYATAMREAAPDALLMGPVMCCWYDFWRTASSTAAGPDEDFLRWFLREVRGHDERTGQRTLDVLDVHYYPQSDVYNDRVDGGTAARRLRSTRALFDPTYVDESWIARPIYLVPRLRNTIDEHYPGTALAISEWNFGADTTINGALAIADVLGIYGREGVDMAAYWRSPPVNSPGFHAFKLHGNYDNHGSSFGGTVLDVTTSSTARLSAFATLDEESGRLQVMLISKDPAQDVDVYLTLAPLTEGKAALRYRYSTAAEGIVAEDVDADPAMSMSLPASSITLLVVEGGDTEES